MINFLYPSYLSPAELNILTDRIIETVTSSSFAKENLIMEIVKELEKDLQHLETAIKKSKKNEYTKTLKEMDYKRSSAFISLRDYLKACLNHRDEKTAKNASILYAVLKKHNLAISRLGYTNKSAKINLILDELNHPPYGTIINEINCQSWYLQLSESHHDFETVLKQKMALDALNNSPAIKTIRPQLIRHLMVLIDVLSIKEELNPGEFDQTVSHINEIINSSMAISRSRKTRNNKSNNNEQSDNAQEEVFTE